MKVLIQAAILLSTSLSSAATLKCEVITPQKTAGALPAMIIAEVNEQVTSIQLFQPPKNPVMLFSESHRGGYPISFCEKEENQVNENKLNVYSECFFGKSPDKVFFNAILSSNEEGILEIVVVPKLAKAFKMEIHTQACD